MHFPTISLNRAQAIADTAVLAGLAQLPASEAEGYRYSPALKAKLAELGVGSPLALSVDQAEEVEAFIAAEAGQRA